MTSSGQGPHGAHGRAARSAGGGCAVRCVVRAKLGQQRSGQAGADGISISHDRGHGAASLHGSAERARTGSMRRARTATLAERNTCAAATGLRQIPHYSVLSSFHMEGTCLVCTHR